MSNGEPNPRTVWLIPALGALCLAWVGVVLVQGLGVGSGEDARLIRGVRGLVATSYVLLPLWGWWRRPTRAGRVWCFAGFGLALALCGLPMLPDDTATRFALSLRHALVLGGVAALVHFALLVPPRPFLAATGVAWLYFPMAVYWGLLMWEVWSQAGRGEAVVVIARVGGALLLLGYALVAVILVSRQAVRERIAGQPAGAWRLAGALLAALMPPVLVTLMAQSWPVLWVVAFPLSLLSAIVLAASGAAVARAGDNPVQAKPFKH